MTEIEGAPSQVRVLEAFGHEYEVAERVALMPMLRFAHLAKKGADSADMEAMAAMYDLLRAVFTDDAWEQFQQDASDERADAEQLLGLVQKAITVISARPTSRPSDSTPGPQTTTESSTGSSSFAERRQALGLVPVTESLEELTG